MGPRKPQRREIAAEIAARVREAVSGLHVVTPSAPAVGGGGPRVLGKRPNPDRLALVGGLMRTIVPMPQI
jgi:hypothetical protein